MSNGLRASHAAAQGIRPARQTDVAAIQELLAPLEQAGITKKRTRRDLYADLQHFTVVEREAKVGPISQRCVLWLSSSRHARDAALHDVISRILGEMSEDFIIGGASSMVQSAK